MPDNQHSFAIPDEHSNSALISILEDNFAVRISAETAYDRVFHDTFDWRLYNNGSVLETHDDGGSHKIYWRADKDSRLRIQLGLKRVPHLAADIPADELRQQLQSVISVRELLPRIKIRTRRRSLAILDDNEKVVVRINLDAYWYSPAKLRAAKVLARHLTIKAVKGYAEEYRRVETFLSEMPLQSATDNVMKLALIESGLRTGEYSTRLNFLLDPEMPYQEAAKKIMLRLLEIMQQNSSGCIKGIDTEFMHDFRVSIKKIRVALKHIDDVFPQAVSIHYQTFFSKLGKLSNPVRDLDVFLLQLGSYQSDFEEADWQHLQTLREYLSLSRAEAQKKLVGELKSSAYREDIQRWRDHLEFSDTDDQPGKKTFKLADELIWSINQLTLKQGKAITKKSSAETLHELRKMFKKLRYLIEFFRSLYPAIKLRVLTQTLIDVQDSLGEYNDLHVQAGMVKDFIEQIDDEDALKAGEQMIKILHKKQLDADKKFKDSFKTYSSAASQKKFKEMFIEYYEGQD